MNDYNDRNILLIRELRTQYSVLDSYLISLEDKIKHYEEGTATVYTPNQSSYKDLELKLKNFETNRFWFCSRVCRGCRIQSTND